VIGHLKSDYRLNSNFKGVCRRENKPADGCLLHSTARGGCGECIFGLRLSGAIFPDNQPDRSMATQTLNMGFSG